MRIKITCTKVVDFDEQTDKLTSMFKDKGYQDGFLEKERIKIWDMDRGSLLENIKNRVDNVATGICIVLDYNLQTRDVEKIISKYWQVLNQDTQLTDNLMDKLQIIYKRDKLVHIVVEPLKPKPWMFW